ncbi:MAG: hypothetical protein AB8I58_03820 [Anaerolineales bacterium]
MSDFQIHFTKGSDLEEAYQNLKSIVDGRAVSGTNFKVRDDSNCVCFSEAPLSSLKSGLFNPSFYSPYSPFGIITTKQHIHTLGGRYVIYQPESEFSQLAPANQWRHVRYEPPSIDFTWEREWRLKTEAYEFLPSNTKIIVPSETWAQRLIGEYDDEQEWQTIQYSQVMEEELAKQYEEPFPWKVVELSNT